MFVLTFKDLPYHEYFKTADYIFNYVFLVELIIKAFFSEHRKSKFYYFEFLLILLSIVSYTYFSTFRILRILKSIRLLRLPFNSQTFFKSVKIASLSILPTIVNIYILLMIFTIILCNVYPNHPRFVDGYTAFQTLLNMFKGTEWNEILNDIAHNSKNIFFLVCVKIIFSFFLIWTCLFTFSFINSKVMENLNQKNDDNSERLKRIEEKLNKIINES